MSTTPEKQRAWNTALTVKPGNVDLHIPTENIQGEIPLNFHGGSLLSNGPGWNQYGDINIHPFDGHGYVRSFAFHRDGSVSLKARFVETEAYQRETKDGQLSIRGFATNPHEQFWKNIGYDIPRNVANTTVYRWGDRLLTGWEGGAPHSLNPTTLDTLGVETFDGLIADKTTLAHMHHDPVSDRLIVVSLQMGRHTTLTIYELDEEDKCVNVQNATLPHTAFVHDFAFSENWTIFGGNALRIRPLEFAKTLMGASTMLNSVATDTTIPGELFLVSRTEKDVTRRIRLPKSVYVVHFVNAFEQSDGTLIVDACIFHDFPFGEEFGYTGKHTPFDPARPDSRDPQRLYRIAVSPNSDEAQWEQISPYGIDFPRVRYADCGNNAPYMVGATRSDQTHSDPFDSLIYIDLQDPEYPAQIWTTQDHCFVGEPIIVDNPDGSDHVVVLISDGLNEHTTMNIFEVENLKKGPVCSISLPLLPIAFHGEWDPKGREQVFKR